MDIGTFFIFCDLMADAMLQAVFRGIATLFAGAVVAATISIIAQAIIDHLVEKRRSKRRFSLFKLCIRPKPSLRALYLVFPQVHE